jgi:hypothetical protein
MKDLKTSKYQPKGRNTICRDMPWHVLTVCIFSTLFSPFSIQGILLIEAYKTVDHGFGVSDGRVHV